ncbi:MAG: DsrE/DsrF/DrsH-like family protein, partial [Lentisphaeria bacterium]
QVLPPLDPEMARDLETVLRQHQVGLHLGKGAAVAAVHDRAGRLAVELQDGSLLEADFALLAAGVRPDSALAAAAGLELGPRGGIRVDARLRTSDPDIYAAGDAVEVVDAVTGQPAVIPLAGPANRQGRIVADNLAGRDSAYAGTQGTAIVKLFGLTAGGTGASEKTLRRIGRPYAKVYLHPTGHAGYYPGTAPMHLKLLFAPDTGKLLGAQAVGHDGVDKRLDVLATALGAGLTVEDLQRLELAYAPPYGAAKDPVNMAGFIAANLRRGDVAFWYAEEFPGRTAGALLLDVRSPQEFELGHLEGAVNLPLGQLRARLDSLPKDRPLRLYCKVGLRSYLAYRVLRQRGFADVQTLAGGLLTFNRVHPAPAAPRGTGDRPVAPTPVPAAVGATGRPPLQVDCCGLQCPGPLQRLAREAATLQAGDELTVTATDPGFPADARAWCGRQGHTLLGVTPRDGGRFEARIRLSATAATAAVAETAPPAGGAKKKTIVVFSGDLDRVLAAFVIANGAVAMGSPVTMFFTFWGLNALRKAGPQAGGKGIVDRMFGLMMPKGPGALKLSKMNFLGAGTAMMKWVMRRKQAPNLPDLIAQARAAGVRLVACTMSMDVMGLKREELLDGLELGGAATFLGEADQSSATLFV